MAKEGMILVIWMNWPFKPNLIFKNKEQSYQNLKEHIEDSWPELV